MRGGSAGALPIGLVCTLRGLAMSRSSSSSSSSSSVGIGIGIDGSGGKLLQRVVAYHQHIPVRHQPVLQCRPH